MASFCLTAIDEFKNEGIEVGLFIPNNLCLFRSAVVRELASRAGRVLAVEMSLGQMIEDAKAAVGLDVSVGFVGRAGGIVPLPDEVVRAFEESLGLRSSDEQVASSPPSKIRRASHDSRSAQSEELT